MLYEYQSGLRGSFSTDSCLIHLSDHKRGQTSKGLFIGMIMLDLLKAFDTVDRAMGVESMD
ncbi:hypothetical protein DPMN_071932 [Dreissena polymorpha]|uniref:Reverse transcriptase n=1 Tax=Dreissena polymorpha TaxID=45954 RepID=A0A9D3Z3K8_DREPO|nr:hypothetical protein DPMN_071932 [Dreissena polymorpha]